MKAKPFEAAHVSELEIKTGPENPRWATVRSHFDIGAFGVNAWTSEQADQEVIGEHDEVGPRAGRHEELYFVAAGHATFTVAGEEIEAPAGTFVFVRDPATKRKAVAREAGTTVLVVGGPRGEAFSPAQWERGARALRYWSTGEFDKAIQELSAVHEQYPDDASVLYNLACAESMVGKRAEAIGHLRQAVELSSDFGELAAEDSDFDAIRDDPGFASAIAGQPDAAGKPS